MMKGLFYASAVLPLLAAAQSSSFPDGVLATGTMGTTNPPEPTAPTSVNQTSYARLLTVNSIEDFCFFAPPEQQAIADSETIEVAWCTQPRNNARVIPDGTLTGVSFLKTSFYVQILAFGDFTKINIPAGDEGGELDPHGAYGTGNPIGGNVTSNITGADEHFAEWMQYISDTQLCLRVCTSANSTYDAAHMCWHELDEMGCEFVMPGNYNFNSTFETCDADVAYPPGWYPTVVDGTTSFSTFAQYWTGTVNGTPLTLGDTVTPSAPASTPSSSNCQTTATVSNGLAVVSGSMVQSGSASGATSGGASASRTDASSSGSATASGNAAVRAKAGQGLWPVGVLFASLISVVAGVVLLC